MINDDIKHGKVTLDLDVGTYPPEINKWLLQGIGEFKETLANFVEQIYENSKAPQSDLLLCIAYLLVATIHDKGTNADLFNDLVKGLLPLYKHLHDEITKQTGEQDGFTLALPANTQTRQVTFDGLFTKVMTDLNNELESKKDVIN